jgi:hypothetical protein
MKRFVTHRLQPFPEDRSKFRPPGSALHFVRTVPELAREIGVSAATIYTWKSKYGGMDVSDAQKLKGLEDENRRLKHLVADLSLDKEVLKER